MTGILVTSVVMFVCPLGAFLVISSLNRSSLRGKCDRLLLRHKEPIRLGEVEDLQDHYDRLQRAEGFTGFLGLGWKFMSCSQCQALCQQAMLAS